MREEAANPGAVETATEAVETAEAETVKEAVARVAAETHSQEEVAVEVANSRIGQSLPELRSTDRLDSTCGGTSSTFQILPLKSRRRNRNWTREARSTTLELEGFVHSFSST